MSWFSGLANKAEDMLNSVDKAAASTLSKHSSPSDDPYTQWKPKTSTPTTSSNQYLSQISKPARASQKAQEPVSRSSHSEGALMTTSASVPSNLSKMNSDSGTGSVASMSRSLHAQNSKKKDSDEELFEFLNSPDTLDTGSNGINKRKDKVSSIKTGNISNGHSRQSSTSSISSQRSGKTPEASAVINMSDISDLQGEISNTSEPEALSPMHEVDSDGRGSPQAAVLNQTEGESQSSLELENQLLKSEISSLNQEMSSIIKRAKESHEELSRVRRQIDSQSGQLSKHDSIIRELQARETDLTEALGAKDSQLAVLRVRFEESEKDLTSKRTQIERLEEEKHRILNDHTSVSGAQNQALDGLKEKLAEAEKVILREKESYSKAQQEAMERQSKLEEELKSVSDSLKSAERRANDERGRCSEMSAQLRTVKSQADSSRRELNDYKEKAARILQSKDRLITSLKEGSAGGVGAAAAGGDGMPAVELEEVRQERDLLREELQQARMTAESLRTEIQDLEVSLQTEQDAASEAQRHLQEQLDTEQVRRQDAEQEVARQKKELQFARDELINQKTGHQRQLHDRDTEIDRLRSQLTTRSASSSSQAELENRLHALTESLIHKQTMVEALSTEKNSLVLQLERLEQQHKILQETTESTRATAIHMHDDDEVRQRLPGFMRESPLDGDVARRVKRAANSIDKFSVRLGVFLRRYPIARVFVICYMVLLHLWVMIVLLTYQPEIHSHDYSPQAP